MPTQPRTSLLGCIAILAIGAVAAVAGGAAYFGGGDSTPSQSAVVRPSSASAPGASSGASSSAASASQVPSAAPATAIAAAQPSPSASPQGGSAAAAGTPTPRPTVAARVSIPNGFVVAPDPAGGANVQWVELSGGIDPDHFSVRINGREATTVPFVTGTIEYRVTVAQACGAADVVVVAVQGTVEAATAPFHVVLPACP
jgi:hypothetical protein